MANTLATLSLVLYGLAVVFLIMAVIFFIKFHIPAIIGDLSGRTAKKSIERIRSENEKTGKKTYMPSPVNLKRGKITEGIESVGSSGTLKLKTNSDSPETVVLAENKADAYSRMSAETSVLEDEGTTILGQPERSEETVPLGAETPAVQLQMIEEIVMIHTDEKI